jgi:cytidyltransferase-like protein
LPQSKNTGTRRNAEVINDYQQLRDHLRAQHSGQRIVCTIGSWDILHEGHIAYLREAREQGDVLIVGVDSDEAYKLYKKETAFYPEADRQAIVAAIRYVDYVTTVRDVNERGEWGMHLVTVIQPDVFVCNDVTYSVQQRKRLEELSSGMVRSLPFHTSSSVSASVSASIRLKRSGRFSPTRSAVLSISTFIVSLVAFLMATKPLLSKVADWSKLMRRDMPLLPSLTLAQGIGGVVGSLLAAGVAASLSRFFSGRR